MVRDAKARDGAGMRVFRRSLLISLAGSGLLAASSAWATCGPVVADEQQTIGAARPITAEDLLGLRDIGSSERPASENVIGVSPDGRRIAFMLTRAEARTNQLCQALVTMEVRPGARPLVIDQGGEPMFERINMRGLDSDYGYPALTLPKWSPDGRWVAYLKRQNGITQVWRASVDGTLQHAVTHSTIDVDMFTWADGGTAIIFATRPGFVDARDAIDREGLTGFLYDDRFMPFVGSRPAIRMPIPFEYSAADIATGTVRIASDSEKALLDPPPPTGTAEAMLTIAKGPGGKRAWTAQRDPSRVLSQVELWVADERGARIRCEDPVCSGNVFTAISNIWWMPDGKEILFLHKDGWGGSATSLYRWKPGGARPPERVFSTDDLLASCQIISTRLLCAREASAKPRRLVLIDPKTGKSQLLFDPNPDFGSVRLGKVERLHWKNDVGFECFGDLVLPPDYRPGQRLPLIIVQYQTRGFLRGGTGNEYPIQMFASRGYAVLSIQKPPVFYLSLADQNWRTWQEAEAENTKGWRDRRNMLSTIMRGIDLVVSRGIADPERIGITGLSDGATTAQFALVNTRRFAAAAISSMGTDRQALIYGGIGLADRRKREGHPPASQDDPSFWQPLSLAPNAASISTPLLMQLADHEYLLGLESYTALRDHHQPVEMIVFPDEFHLKWQPSHRLAIYQRNIDWFDFWLKHREDPDPAKASQYARWEALRVESEGAISQPALLRNEASPSP